MEVKFSQMMAFPKVEEVLGKKWGEKEYLYHSA